MKRRNTPRDGLRRQAERLDALVQMVTRLQCEQTRTDGALKDAELAIQRLKAANQWNAEWTACFGRNATEAYYAHAQRAWEAAVQQAKDASNSASRNDRCEASPANDAASTTAQLAASAMSAVDFGALKAKADERAKEPRDPDLSVFASIALVFMLAVGFVLGVVVTWAWTR